MTDTALSGLDQESRVDRLTVRRYATGPELGAAAAALAAHLISDAIAERGVANVVLATGQSQRDFIGPLRSAVGDWSRVNVFHQDEYIGMSPVHPASFRRWMRENVVDLVQPLGWFPLNGDADSTSEEVHRYAQLLAAMRPDVCVIGVGENGHIAFNDPPADVSTKALVHAVDLDEGCRRQQVNEGHFPSLADVPERAISLTVAGILWGRRVIAVVPESRKALAVRTALQAPVSSLCPASLLRDAGHADLFIDRESGALFDADEVAADVAGRGEKSVDGYAASGRQQAVSGP